MKYTASHLEDSIEFLYEKYNLNRPNLPVEVLAEKFGIIICHHNKITFSFEKVIFMDLNNSEERKKEIFAHELGHILHHAGIQTNLNNSFRLMQEYKANNFALHFCIPTFILHNIELPSTSNEAIELIADTFGVTHQFAAKRLAKYRLQVAQAYQDEFIKSYYKVI